MLQNGGTVDIVQVAAIISLLAEAAAEDEQVSEYGPVEQQALAVTTASSTGEGHVPGYH